jgi:hypothetical protein
MITGYAQRKIAVLVPAGSAANRQCRPALPVVADQQVELVWVTRPSRQGMAL